VVTLARGNARAAEAIGRTSPPRYQGGFVDGRHHYVAPVVEEREVSVLDAAYGEDMVFHLSANNAVVSDDGYVLSIPDLSRHHNDVTSFYEFGIAPLIVTSGGPNGSSYIDFTGVEFEGLYNFDLAGLVSSRRVQIHILMQITTPQSPPAAFSTERYVSLLAANGATMAAVRINTELEPDNIVFLHTGVNDTAESTVAAALDRSDFFVWSGVAPSNAPIILKRNGATVATGSLRAPWIRGAVTQLLLPAISGANSRYRFVDLIVVGLAGNETAAQAAARIAYYADTYGITVTS
jgi:hypothetical protein